MEAMNLSNREGCPTIFSIQMEVPEKVVHKFRVLKRAFHDAASVSFFSF